MDELRHQGVQLCHLEVAEDNDPARLMYAKLGFHETTRRKNYYKRSGGLCCDAVCAQLKLDEAV